MLWFMSPSITATVTERHIVLAAQQMSLPDRTLRTTVENIPQNWG